MINNFFNISDLSSQDLLYLLSNKFEKSNVLKGKNIGMIFEKYSTRTRLSFKVAIHDLGGNPIDIRFDELNISREESFEDTFRAMNCYLDGIVYRTSKHDNLLNASKFFQKPIINALSEKSHPCQIISDLYTLKENFGDLNINIIWVGDMNNVCFSLVEAVNLIKTINLLIYTPKYISNKINWKFNENIKVFDSIRDIDLSSYNCVMTDVFHSMNDNNDIQKMKDLQSYMVDKKITSKLSDNYVFMHCLPAKVDQEVSKEIFFSEHSIVWKQAYNRLIMQKKLLNFIDWN